MKTAYIILAYTAPQQVARLIHRLNQPNTSFFLHIDKRVNIRPFQQALRNIPLADIRFVTRENSSWASFETVQASLNAMKDIIADGSFQRMTLISGFDYPIKNKEQLNHFYANHAHQNFIEHQPMLADSQDERLGMERLEKYYFAWRNNIFEYPMNEGAPSIKRKVLSTAMGLFLDEKRPFNLDLKPHKGEHWWSLNKEAGKYILDYINDHPEVVRRFKYTFAPDEMFYHTILANASEELRESLVNRTITEVKWPKEACPRPEVFTEKDFRRLKRSKMLFARKVVSPISNQLLDMIDMEIFGMEACELRYRAQLLSA